MCNNQNDEVFFFEHQGNLNKNFVSSIVQNEDEAEQQALNPDNAENGRPKKVLASLANLQNSYKKYKITDLFPYKIYTVDYDGETLEQISAKLGIPLQELIYLNDISKEDQARPLEPLTVKLFSNYAHNAI